MPFFSMFVWGTRRTSLLIAALMIGLIAAIDAHAAPDIPLGFLYLAPMLVTGAAFKRWEIGVVAVICAWLAEAYDAECAAAAGREAAARRGSGYGT